MNYSYNLLILFFFLISGLVFSQTTSIKLPTADSTSNFSILQSDNSELLKIGAGGTFFIDAGSSTSAAAKLPLEGAGTRFMWLPDDYALRVGTVSGTQWDKDKIGVASVAFGQNNEAGGDYSFAAGVNSRASRFGSFAYGSAAFATEEHAFAFGYQASASGKNTMAFGYRASASAKDSYAIGNSAEAGADNTIAIGNTATANTENSIAIGNTAEASTNTEAISIGAFAIARGNSACAVGAHAFASGDAAFAIGYQADATHDGAFVLCDNSGGVGLSSSTANEITMRFTGGYNFYSNSAESAGVTLSSGGGSWSSISDSTKKTNFVEADGEYFLESISKLRLGSWNYKSQDPEEHRHYGPMAQEIFHYFGKDKYGTIGNDTTLATADMDGIMMIALQALEKRTSELKEKSKEVNKLKEIVAEQGDQIEKLKAKFETVKNILATMKNGQEKDVRHTKVFKAGETK